VSRGFTPRRVQALEPRIRAMSVAYLDALPRRAASCDVIRDFAGEAADGRDQRAARRAAQADRAPAPHLGGPARASRGGRAQTAAGRPPRRFTSCASTSPSCSASGRRARGTTSPARCSRRRDRRGPALGREIIGFLFLMIVAGNETTTKLLGNALYWLWRNPDQRDRRRRSHAGAALGRGDAALRQLHAGAGPHRLTDRDVELHGDPKLRAGERTVVLLIGSANRDEQAFPEPDRFDLAARHPREPGLRPGHPLLPGRVAGAPGGLRGRSRSCGGAQRRDVFGLAQSADGNRPGETGGHVRIALVVDEADGDGLAGTTARQQFITP
jgi:cytochrome P450